ncbi:MAG: hypothetical protein NT109_04045 [Flavobacteriia bacterium]|nr:hypothetical protein [Flavobacteriia bacterium]
MKINLRKTLTLCKLIVFLVIFSGQHAYAQCTHQIQLTDTWGDGWNGGAVSVSVNGSTVLNNITFNNGYGPATANFSASSGQTIIVWRTSAGSYPSEMRIKVIVQSSGQTIINTVQPVPGSASSGGHLGTATCSGGGVVGCVNPYAYGSANAPSSPGVVTINGCNYQSEYNTIYGVVSGTQYQSTFSLGGWITVRRGAVNGTVVGQGSTPLTWTATTSETYYVHYTVNSGCTNAYNCGTSTIQCLSCAAPAAPANDLVCNATAISCGQTLAGTTVNATNSGTGENGFCSISQTQPGVWYAVSGNGQIMTANLCATAWDSKISVFSGPNCSSLTCVGGNDDWGPACNSSSASFSWTSTAGLNYYILVHGYSSTSAFNIGLTCVSPPPANPTSISATQNTICNGSSTTLTANGVSGTVYWYTNGCGVTQIGTGNSINVSPGSSTTYFARNYNNGQFSAGCVSTSISVNANPTVTISANTNSVCAGNTATLNASGASTYVWAQGGTAASTQVSPNATTTYTVTGTSAGGCTGTAQSTISVNAAPVVTISANTNSVCAGNTATLNASGASTYVWAQGGTAASTQVSPNATTTYTVTGTSAAGCTGTAQSTISVNAAPVANAGADVTSDITCGQNTAQVSAPALANGLTGTWQVFAAAGVALPGSVNGVGNAVTTLTGSYGGTYTLTWTVLNAATGCTGTDTMIVTFNQPNAASLGGMIGSQDVLWNGLSSSDWSTSNNWYQKQAAGHYVRMTSGQPASNTEVFTISNAVGGMCIGNNMPTLSVTSNAEDVYLNTGMSLNLTNDIINLEGNLTNHGTINASTGTINFTGGLSSLISGSGTTSLNNLTVNKSGGQALTVSMPVTVTGVLDMTLGNIFTSTNSILTLGNSSAVPGSLSWTSGNIVGPFRRYFINGATTGNAGLFPVGTAAYNRYAQVNFSSTPGSDQNLTVWYKTGAPLTPANIPLYNGLPLTTQDNQLVQNYSADGYWNVDPTASNYTSSITSAPYSMTLYANNLNGMVTPMITRIIKASGSNSAQNHHVQWQGAGVHTPIAGGTSPVAFAITSTNLQGFSWFNVGSSNNQALPVELLSFSGTCASEQVDLTWQTASEHNSLSFELEKSRDGEVWNVINTQAAAGNSTQLLTYTYSDKAALEGNNYYRLSQYDIDGVDVKAGINLFSVQDLQLAPGIYYISITNGDKTTEVIKQSIR